ncbi:hypothetical protein [Thalassobellus suaedae]|uniref:Uncharacterized protein n=1 Tax=Thalassobellus suaedae TaxID=3074124 RepID=A0ABY9XRC3_9FLAO|nr:hypothetical protein RHP51_14565 [Flavobacteriaceae bacterium HL-DH14]WNH13679.1 hypothetical protein RHP49_05345 [Flavobacteriaceae bacterium HL-DH10]
MLQCNELKIVFGGYGSNQCYCKNSNTGAAWWGDVNSCENCGSWCDANVPTSYTSLICTGPLVQL